MRLHTFGATLPHVLKKYYVYITFGYVWITFVVSFLQILFLDYTFGYVSCDSCVKTHNALQIIKRPTRLWGLA